MDAQPPADVPTPTSETPATSPAVPTLPAAGSSDPTAMPTPPAATPTPPTTSPTPPTVTTPTSPANDPLGIYYQRWEALDKLLDETLRCYGGLPTYNQQATIVQLLASLREFARGQFQFFYYGLGGTTVPAPSAPQARLQSWDNFPVEDILTGILAQVGNDLEIIQRAASQRRDCEGIALQTLKNADALAWCALQPAIEHHIIDTPDSVLTYFQKSAEFYSIPYARVAIIAIPYACASDREHQDYLAIPHEVGHYVYRNPTDAVKRDLKALRLSPPVEPAYKEWVKSVFEELCADIYGCLVAGPVMARDFEDLSLANSQEDLAYGDGQHPNPAVRPLIYCEVLKNPLVDVLADSEPKAWQNVASLLAQQWSDKLYARHTTEFYIKTLKPEGNNQLVKAQAYEIAKALPQDAHSTTPADPKSLAYIVPQIINKLLKQLSDYLDNDETPGVITKLAGWAGRLPANVTPDQLLDLYECNFSHLVGTCQTMSQASTSTTPTSAPTPPFSWRDWVGLNNPKFKDVWPAGAIPSGEVKDYDKMLPNSWGYILYADGWNIAGPGTDYGHPGTDYGHPAV